MSVGPAIKIEKSEEHTWSDDKSESSSQSENDSQRDSDTPCETSGPSVGDSQSKNENQLVIDKLFKTHGQYSGAVSKPLPNIDRNSLALFRC